MGKYPVRGSFTLKPVNLIDILLVIHLLMYVAYRVISADPLILMLTQATLVLYGAIGIVLILLDNQYRIILYIAVAVLGFVLCLLLRDTWNYSLSSFIQSLSYMGAAYMLLRSEHRSWPFKLAYYLVALYLLFELLIRNTPIRELFKVGLSYNYISVIALMSLSVMFLVQEKNKERAGILPVLLFLIIAILGYGRGGILTAVWLLFLFIMIRMFEGRRKTSAVILAGVILLVVIFAGSSVFNSVLNTSAFTKFRQMGMDTPRLQFWHDYLYDCTRSFKNLIMGGHPDIINPEANVHNSFLQMYAALGLLLFIITMVIIVLSVIKDIKAGNFWLLAVISTAFIRIFTDRAMFPGGFELILYYYVFRYIALKENRKVIIL